MLQFKRDVREKRMRGRGNQGRRRRSGPRSFEHKHDALPLYTEKVMDHQLLFPMIVQEI